MQVPEALVLRWEQRTQWRVALTCLPSVDSLHMSPLAASQCRTGRFGDLTVLERWREVLGADLNCSESTRVERSPGGWPEATISLAPALPRPVRRCHTRWRSRRRARSSIPYHLAT